MAIGGNRADLLGRGLLTFGQLGKKYLVQVHQQSFVIEIAYVLSRGDRVISVVVVAAGLQTAELEALVSGLIDGDQVDVVGGESQQEE